MSKNDFSKGSIVKNIISLAIPMTLAQIITVLYNMVDRIYIGRFGENASDALTGLGVCFPVISIIMAFANLFGMGGAPLFSIKRGEGDNKTALKIMGNSFTMLLIFSIILTVTGLIFKKPLLYLLGASNATYPYANEYITIYFMGTVFVMISLGLNAFINAQGFGNFGMLTIILGAGINIILDPIFIFTLNMGVKGAAVATVISQALSAIWTFLFLTGKKTMFKITLDAMRIDFKLILNIISLGMASFMMQITNGSVQMVCNSALAHFGNDTYVGIMTIINSVRELLWLPILGISNSTQPIIGFNYGANRPDRVKEAIRFMVFVIVAIGLVTWALVVLFTRQFISIFTTDAQILKYGVHCMHIYFFGFFLMGLQASGQTVFTGLGKSKQAVFFSILRKGIIVIPLTLLLPLVLGVDGVFIAEPVSNLIGGLACFVTMYFTVYRKL